MSAFDVRRKLRRSAFATVVAPARWFFAAPFVFAALASGEPSEARGRGQQPCSQTENLNLMQLQAIRAVTAAQEPGGQPSEHQFSAFNPRLYDALFGADLRSFVATGQATMACPVIERGTASWYGGRHNGRRTAGGQIFNSNEMTAALPASERAREMARAGRPFCVLDNNTGRATVVRVTDTGGFAKFNRVMDVSEGVARRLGFRTAGTTDLSIMEESCCPALSRQGMQYVSN